MSNQTNDCDPVTGQCKCRDNATGRQCNRCKDGNNILDNNGICIKPSTIIDEEDPTPFPQLCNGVLCQYGALCITTSSGEQTCSCEALQCSNQLRPVCASDRKSYANKCHMRLMGCRSATRLHVLYFGYCKENDRATFAEDFAVDIVDTMKLPAKPQNKLTKCDERLVFRCLHGGTCYVDGTNTARCLCPIGRSGTYCELGKSLFCLFPLAFFFLWL